MENNFQQDNYETNFEESISLDKINDYYLFKENPAEFLFKKGYCNIVDIKY